jgi:RNA polymerase sigma factor (sigma-70 family)
VTDIAVPIAYEPVGQRTVGQGAVGYAPVMPEATPGRWVRDAASGDGVAWGSLVDHFGGLLWAITRSFRLASTDADDVIQTTWLRLVEHLGRIEQPDRIGAWLATTARNECLAVVRRQTRSASGGWELEELADDGPGPDHGLLRDERHRALHLALDALSEPCQRLLRLLAADPPPSYQEVSAALALPVGSIGPSRARCLERLRRRMAGADSVEDRPAR